VNRSLGRPDLLLAEVSAMLNAWVDVGAEFAGPVGGREGEFLGRDGCRTLNLRLG